MSHGSVYFAHKGKFSKGVHAQGAETHRCRVTMKTRGVIGKYGINMKRQVFRDYAHLIGFVQN